MQDVTDLGQAPGAGLADHPSVALHDEILGIGGRVQHPVQIVLRFGQRLVFGARPVAHGLGARHHRVQPGQIVGPRGAQHQAGRQQDHGGLSTVTPTAAARASSGSSDMGMYSPRRHSSPRSS
jgi:hypothetical protein